MLTRENILNIVRLEELIKKGLKMKEISKLTGLSKPAIRYRLKEKGYFFDKKRRKWRKIEKN